MADDISLVVGVDYSDMTGLIKTTDQTKRALGAVAKDFAKTGSQKAYMRGINQIVKAQSKLDSASRMSRSQIMKLGSQMRQEAQFADALAKSTNRLGDAYGFAGKKINRMGVGLQQAGYQVGDFAVQVQGGTNVAVAFGQQFAQLAGIFGPAGALVGAGVAIGTAFIAPLIEAKKAAEDLDKSLRDITTTLKELEGASTGVQKLPDYLQEFAKGASVGVFKDLRVAADKEFADILDGFKNIRDAAFEFGQDAKTNVQTLLSETGKNRELLADVFGGGLEAQDARFQASKEVVMAMNAEIAKIQDSFNAGSVGEFASQVIELRNYLVESGFGASQAVKNLDEMIVSQGLFNEAKEYEIGLIEEENEARAKVVENIKLYYEYSQKSLKAQEELAKAVKRIKDATEDSTKALERENALIAETIKYGEDSKEVQALKAQQAREEFIEQQKSNGILGKNLEKTLEIYDANVAAREELVKFKADALAASKTLDAMFESRTLEFKLRFADETELMSQSVVPDKNKPKKKPSGGRKREVVDINEIIAARKEQIAQDRVLLGLKGEEQESARIYYDLLEQNKDADIKTTEAKLQGAAKELAAQEQQNRMLEETKRQQQELADVIGSSMEDSFMSIVDGTSSVKDAFRDMARDIVAHLFKVLVIQRAIQGIGGALAGSSNAAVADIGGALQSYDGGGYTGSGPRSGGMDGRGGRLAVIHPRETVIDHTKAGSGSGEQVVINQSFNFSANGDDSVKKLIAEAAPQIANLTQKQIMDSRRRGGSMKATFG